MYRKVGNKQTPHPPKKSPPLAPSSGGLHLFVDIVLIKLCFPFAQSDGAAAEQGEYRSGRIHAVRMVGGPVGSRDLLLRLRWIRLHRNYWSVLNESRSDLAPFSAVSAPRVSTTVSWEVSDMGGCRAGGGLQGWGGLQGRVEIGRAHV